MKNFQIEEQKVMGEHRNTRLRINQQTISSESVNKKSSVLQGSGKFQEKSINSRHENPDKKGTIINNNLNRDEIQSVKNTIADSQGENFLLGRKRNAEIPGKNKPECQNEIFNCPGTIEEGLDTNFFVKNFTQSEKAFSEWDIPVDFFQNEPHIIYYYPGRVHDGNGKNKKSFSTQFEEEFINSKKINFYDQEDIEPYLHGTKDKTPTSKIFYSSSTDVGLSKASLEKYSKDENKKLHFSENDYNPLIQVEDRNCLCMTNLQAEKVLTLSECFLNSFVNKNNILFVKYFECMSLLSDVNFISCCDTLDFELRQKALLTQAKLITKSIEILQRKLGAY